MVRVPSLIAVVVISVYTPMRHRLPSSNIPEIFVMFCSSPAVGKRQWLHCECRRKAGSVLYGQTAFGFGRYNTTRTFSGSIFRPLNTLKNRNAETLNVKRKVSVSYGQSVSGMWWVGNTYREETPAKRADRDAQHDHR